MESKRIKVRLNSVEKIEELLQEVYDQACRQINEIQNEINKLINSTNLGSEDFSMDDRQSISRRFTTLLVIKKVPFKQNLIL